MTETAIIVMITSAVQAAVTWGIVRTELRWLRADVDHAHKRLDDLVHAVNRK